MPTPVIPSMNISDENGGIRDAAVALPILGYSLDNSSKSFY
jgi:hypothetical protein